MPVSVLAELERKAGRRARANRGFAAWLRRLLTTDYFPETERVVKRLVWNPAGAMLLAAVVSLLCGVLLSPHALVLFAGLVTVLAVGVVWPWVSLRGLSAGFTFDRPRCREGETVGVSLTVTRRVRWAAAGLAVRGRFEPPDDPNSPVAVVTALPVVPGRRATTVRWTFAPPRRGAYPLTTTPPRLVTGYPFGLRECGRVVTAADPLVVWPKTYPVGALPDVAGNNQLEGCVSRSKAGQTGDVLGVRPYRRGDSPRRVHWAQTARHDRLVVCELQSNARPRVQVILDSDPEAHRGAGPDSSREWAIRVAASLVEGWLAQGAEVEAVIDGLLYPTSAGTPHLRKILDALATLTDDGGPRLANVLAAPVCRSFDGVQVVVTTDRGMAGVEGRTNRLFFALRADGFLTDPCDATELVQTDEDTITITVVPPEVSVVAVANAAEPGTPGVLRFTRTGPTGAALVVNYTVGGTATAGRRHTSGGRWPMPVSGSTTRPGSAARPMPRPNCTTATSSLCLRYSSDSR